MVSPALLTRLARRSLRRIIAQQAFPEVPIKQMPVLFGNSFPKSGTHLLTQILAGFTRLGPVAESGLPPVLTFEGESGRPRTLKGHPAEEARRAHHKDDYRTAKGNPQLAHPFNLLAVDSLSTPAAKRSRPDEYGVTEARDDTGLRGR